ncbi:DMT family transporter [Guyparkeria halophila]|uniref:DMT family transporter n=1 Tax=Guyparkeria halophila TaxID=47960 RepID=A0ABZ0YUF0_9GAMM|nr:DMT family transporter [Guyparkeria halophila]WQH15623.1 DMT family transporter [Guyparkeria halophila]
MTENQHHHRLGLILMALAVLTIPMSDTIAKWLSTALSVGEIAWLRFVFQTLFLLPFVAMYWRGGRLQPIHLLLGALIAASILFLFWGLAHLPLANNIALFFVEPLILVIFSALFLGERITARRWIGVLGGLVGAVVILRPNWSAYGLASLLPIAAAACYAGYLTATRAWADAPRPRDALVLQFWVGAAASLVMLAFMLLGAGLDWSLARWDMPATHEWFWLAIAGLLAAFAHVLIAMAFARSDASLLAPLQYLEIFGATLLGWLIFAEWPDAFTILGGLIIIAAGLIVIRERPYDAHP